MEKQCPLVGDYRFTSRCTIKTCKNYTPSTTNRCMALDVKPSSEDAVISDAELLHYKFPDREMTVKDVTRVRRRVVDRVHHWLMFHSLVYTIATTCDPAEFEYTLGKSETLDSILKSKPFSLSEFSFQPWMLKRLMDDQWCRSIVPSFSLRNLLSLNQREYESVCKDINVMGSGRTLFETIV